MRQQRAAQCAPRNLGNAKRSSENQNQASENRKWRQQDIPKLRTLHWVSHGMLRNETYNIRFRNLIEVRKIAKIIATAILTCHPDFMKAYTNHFSYRPYAVSIRWVGRNAQSALHNFYQIDLENVETCTAKNCPRNRRCQILTKQGISACHGKIIAY